MSRIDREEDNEAATDVIKVGEKQRVYVCDGYMRKCRNAQTSDLQIKRVWTKIVSCGSRPHNTHTYIYISGGESVSVAFFSPPV